MKSRISSWITWVGVVPRHLVLVEASRARSPGRSGFALTHTSQFWGSTGRTHSTRNSGQRRASGTGSGIQRIASSLVS
jgi:hypothetical protein